MDIDTVYLFLAVIGALSLTISTITGIIQGTAAWKVLALPIKKRIIAIVIVGVILMLPYAFSLYTASLRTTSLTSNNIFTPTPKLDSVSPTTSTATTSAAMINPMPTIPGLLLSYTLDFGDRTYVDLDTGHADLTGGADDELTLADERLFYGGSYKTWAKTAVVYISDSQASYQGCTNGTLIQQGDASLYQVQQDQSICVATSKGNWAVMKMKKGETSSPATTFDVSLFQP